MFKDYKVFCGTAYRYFMWIVYPLLIVIGNWAFARAVFAFAGDVSFPQGTLEQVLYIPSGFVVAFEIFTDKFFVRDVHRDGVGGFLYFQSSTRGLITYGNAMRVDMIRKSLMLLGCNTLGYCFVSTRFEVSWSALFAMLMIEFIVLIVGVTSSRSFGSLMLNILIAIASLYLCEGLVYLYLYFFFESYTVSTILIFVVIFVENLHLYIMNRRGRASYYDL
ncbi:MAG: hypothetical protein K6G05_08760 [Lachnospiraceae bacterium]|nr:hypothetical protein [Lachnospiraceae bacterium]